MIPTVAGVAARCLDDRDGAAIDLSGDSPTLAADSYDLAAAEPGGARRHTRTDAARRVPAAVSVS